MINLTLTYTVEQVQLSIVDDGQGFGPNLNTDGFGASGMRQRSDLIQAELSIISSLNCGTEVRVTVPIQEKR